MLSKGWESEIHIVNIYKKRNAEREKKKQIDEKERRKERERLRWKGRDEIDIVVEKYRRGRETENR